MAEPLVRCESGERGIALITSQAPLADPCSDLAAAALDRSVSRP